MRRSRGSLMALVLGIFLASVPAAAHPDRDVMDGEQLVPGHGTLSLDVELHYHRLVGRVHSLDAGVPLVVRVTGESDTFIAGPGDDLRLNAVVPCCKHDAWTQHTILIENTGDADAHVQIRMVLLHDTLAVLADNAEDGSILQTFVFFAIGLAVAALRLRAGPHPGDPRRHRIAAIGLHGVTWLIAIPLALLGMLRYGGGPAAGTLAAVADLPRIEHVILTTHTVVFGVLMLLWLPIILYWVGAVRRSTTNAERVTTGRIGIVLGIGTLIPVSFWAVEYQAIIGPLVLGSAAAALPLAGGFWLMFRARAGGPEAAYHHA